MATLARLGCEEGSSSSSSVTKTLPRANAAGKKGKGRGEGSQRQSLFDRVAKKEYNVRNHTFSKSVMDYRQVTKVTDGIQ